MVELYKNRFNDNFSVSINDVDIFAEDVTSEESYNRREEVRQKILGGTEFVSDGAWIPRKFSFTTHLRVAPERPDVYDTLFQDWSNNPVEVISPEMGGMFKARVIIKKEHTAPSMLTVSFTLTEIPEE